MSFCDPSEQQAESRFDLLHALPYPTAVFRAADGSLLAANERFNAAIDRPDRAPTTDSVTGLGDADTGRLRMRLDDRGVVLLASPAGFRSRIEADIRAVRCAGQDCWLVTAPVPAGPGAVKSGDLKAEANYRALVENLNDIVYTTDEKAIVTYVSPNIRQLSGYAPIEVIGRSFTEFVHPEDLQGRIGQFLKILGGAKQATEYRMVTKSGEIKWARTSARPIVRRDRVVGVQGILVDISDRKVVEEALRRSEEKYRVLVQNSKDAIFVIQGDYLKFMNPSASEILGYNCESVAHRRFWEFIHPDDRETIKERYELRLRGQSLFDRVAFRIVNRDGDIRDVDLNAVLITWDEKPAILNFLRDVTVWKRMEDQLRNAQKMEALGTLSGGIAHNFNNLLMGIHGNASLALAKQMPQGPARSQLEKIIQLVHSGSKLTRQLLDYARGGACELATVDLNQLIREACDTLTATRKQIRIRHELSDDAPLLKADQGQIEQVLLNLLLNAADAMPDGGEVVIETACLKGSQSRGKVVLYSNRDYVLVKVTDHGAGIPEKIQERIFEPFFTTKAMGRGTGLGLSTAYGIVKSHDGEICVESAVGKGSTFLIYLPAVSAGAPTPAVDVEPEAMRGQGTILLVDDEQAVIEPSAELLRTLGFTVLQASSGSTAMQIFQQDWQRIDLVILDLIMPDIGGKDLYYNFRRINPQVKVLVSSGYSLSGQAEELLGNGCCGFIQKPYDMHALSAAMMEILAADQ